MLYMAKDRKLIYLPIYVICTIIYFSYLIYDYNNQLAENIKDFGIEKGRLASEIEFDAIILGGSNVAFSLSAVQLTSNTSYSWFNFGISSEGFSDNNYWNYLENTIDRSKREKIKLVFYSSSTPLKRGLYVSRENNSTNVWGEKKFSMFPKISLLYRLNMLLKNTSEEYVLPTERGDFDFRNFDCSQSFEYRFGREEKELVFNWLNIQYNDIRNLFPNAKIIFSLPSEYYGEKIDIKKIENYDKYFSQQVSSISNEQALYFSQVIFVNKQIMCNSMMHSNSEGRTWKTNELINQLNNFL